MSGAISVFGGEPIATPSIWSQKEPLNKKCVSAVANEKGRLSSEGVSLRSGFLSEMYLTAKSIHSSRGMLVFLRNVLT